MIPQRALRTSYIIILTITLTVILISSPVIAVFSPSFLSPPMVLKVEFASASSDDDGGDDESNTDDAAAAATDEGGEEGAGDGDDEQQQEENNNQQQQAVQEEVTEDDQGGQQPLSTQDLDREPEEEEQQQLATVVGEICDDFEDNDADGLIDLADVEDCAPPATQGTVTAPTTPPPSSVANTTATNSTNNTLTASEITTPPTTANSGTAGGLGPPWDLAKQCIPIEQLPGISPPASSADDPPNLRWYSCPDGLLWSDPPITSNSGIGQFGGGGGQQQQQQQQQPNSASACPPQPTNYYDATAQIIHVQLTPSSSPSPSSPPPSQSTTTNPCPPGQSSPTQTADTIAPSIVAPSFTVEADSEQGTQVSFTVAAHDTVDGAATLEEDGVTVTQDSVGGNIAISCAPNSGGVFPVGDTNVRCVATDQANNAREHSFTITVKSSSSSAATPPPPPQTLQAPPPSTTTTPQGGEQGQQQPPPNSAATPPPQTLQAPPPSTTTTPQGGEQGQQQPPPNSAATPPQAPPDEQPGEDPLGDQPPPSVEQPPSTTSTSQGGQQGQEPPPPPPQEVPGTTSPSTSTGTTTPTFPDRISITKDPDGSTVRTEIPDMGVTITSVTSNRPGGAVVDSVTHPKGALHRDSDDGVTARLPNDVALRLLPDGTGGVGLGGDTDIASKGDGTLTIHKSVTDPATGVRTSAIMTTTYSPDGTVVITNPDGTSTALKTGSVNGDTTTFPDGISITKDPNRGVYTRIPNMEVAISSSPSGRVEEIVHPNGILSRNSDNSVTARLPNDVALRLLPDGTGGVGLGGDTDIASKGDGTLGISKPVTDPNTGARTGAIMTITYPPP